MAITGATRFNERRGSDRPRGPRTTPRLEQEQSSRIARPRLESVTTAGLMPGRRTRHTGRNRTTGVWRRVERWRGSTLESAKELARTRSRATRSRRGGRARYSVHVVYLWLPTVDLALTRVAERVWTGGHDVPAETVRRRFDRGRRNFFTLYRPLADTWRLYDASAITGPRLVATGGQEEPTKLRDPKTWREAAKGYDDE